MKKKILQTVRIMGCIALFAGVTYADTDGGGNGVGSSILDRFWGTSCTTVFEYSTIIQGSCVSAKSCTKYRFFFNMGTTVSWETVSPCGPG